MSGIVSLQADIGSIPPGAVELLRSIAPIMRSLTADNVSPLAVIQIEDIGRCFHTSGLLANRTRDALTRSGSVRFRRLQVSIGWMAGDTAAALSQTTGGQAAALLTLCLVEMFCRNSTGHLLFELSMKILPPDKCRASMAHLSDLAEIISNKLQPLGFGQHHAVQLTRIREAYLNSGIEIPPSTSESLLERLSIESMVELLDAVQQALRDETTIVHIEGFQGLGGIIALLTALCPDDILLLVENGILFKGPRQSIIISVMHQKKTTFSIEKLALRQLPLTFRDSEFLSQPGRLSSYEHCTVRVQGCLARMVEQLFTPITFQSVRGVVASFTDLVGAMVLSFIGTDFGSNAHFCRDGLHSLLGPHFHETIRGKLSLFFEVEPSLDNLGPVLKYEALRQSIASVIPSSSCVCSQCIDTHNWANMSSKRCRCPLYSIWGGLQTLVGQAVLLSLVHTDLDTVKIVQSSQNQMGQHLCRRLMHHVLPSDDPLLDQQGGKRGEEIYSTLNLHTDLCTLFGSIPSNAGGGQNILGTSNGATSIFPSTLHTGFPNEGRIIRYILMDGQFHDGHNYYTALIEDEHVLPRPLAEDSILQSTNTIPLSQAGTHSQATLSLRPYHNSLAVRFMALFTSKAVNICFYATHLAYMAASIAPPCHHNADTSTTTHDKDSILTTSVDAPVASGDRMSMVLTHGNSEAQFLAAVLGVPTLYQGASCLDCMIKFAQTEGFRLLIQS
ncbi:uncharacterized protein F4817DRAFT_219801 [Daldinia loculata]|uniref:uncharacterized protein n=1 Tax=Daldinia loculata TaxID=103429 RepID=UPI0020C5AE16|nr:uncharacterized protein F4817DRAFT_219801 [Daldinia loculata]KAI1644371.1 hypothetical protein F4817DRAFT_219801 [Daldinia loculata]